MGQGRFERDTRFTARHPTGVTCMMQVTPTDGDGSSVTVYTPAP